MNENVLWKELNFNRAPKPYIVFFLNCNVRSLVSEHPGEMTKMYVARSHPDLLHQEQNLSRSKYNYIVLQFLFVWFFV